MLDLSYSLERVLQEDPAARNKWEVLLLYPGIHALLCYRLAHALHKRRFYFIARALSQLARFITGIEIHQALRLGEGFLLIMAWVW